MNQQGGFNPEDYMRNIEMENAQLQQKNLELSGALTSSGFQEHEEQNLIVTQLETDKLLERFEHFLKGDKIKFNENGAYFTEPTKNVLAMVKKDIRTKIYYYIQDVKEAKKGSETIKEVLVKIKNKDGQETNVLETDSRIILDKLKKVNLKDIGYRYVEIVDEDKKPLNEYGVAEMMRIISMYVSKETFLSYYGEERIYEIMGDFGDALDDFLYCTYEKMGMDTKFKESKYIMICLNILHLVESCYRRALNGNEQENLRTRAIVTQNQGIGGFGGQKQQMSKKWHPLKPNTW